MQIIITRSTVVNKQCVDPGAVVEVDEAEGLMLIGLRKAQAVTTVPVVEIADTPAVEQAVLRRPRGNKKQGD